MHESGAVVIARRSLNDLDSLRIVLHILKRRILLKKAKILKKNFGCENAMLSLKDSRLF